MNKCVTIMSTEEMVQTAESLIKLSYWLSELAEFFEAVEADAKVDS